MNHTCRSCRSPGHGPNSALIVGHVVIPRFVKGGSIIAATPAPLLPWGTILLLAACGSGGGANSISQPAIYSTAYDSYWSSGYAAALSGYAARPHPGTPTSAPAKSRDLNIPEYGRSRFDIYENHPIHKPVLDIGNRVTAGSLPADFGDNQLFRIDAAGRIYFRQSPDFEAPYDLQFTGQEGSAPGRGFSAKDNIYHLYILNGETSEIHHAEIRVHNLVSERGWRQPVTDRPTQVIQPNQIPSELQPPEPDPQTEIGIKHVMSGRGWTMPAIGPLILTWSMATYLSPDAAHNPRLLKSDKLIEEARVLINRVFSEFESAANLRFIEVDENESVMGHLRFRFAPPEIARGDNHAYFPGQAPGHTTIHISTNMITDEGHAESFGILLHEIGHALGLGHIYDAQHGWSKTIANPVLPSQLLDGTDRYFPQLSSASSIFHAPVLSEVDIATLQYMYGRPETTNAGLFYRLYGDGTRPPSEIVLPRGKPATEFRLSRDEVTISGQVTEQKLADFIIVDDGIGVNTPYIAPKPITETEHGISALSNAFHELLEFRFSGGTWSLWFSDAKEHLWEWWRNSFHEEQDSETGDVKRVNIIDFYLSSSGGTSKAPENLLTTRLRVVLDPAHEPDQSSLNEMPPATLDVI